MLDLVFCSTPDDLSVIRSMNPFKHENTHHYAIEIYFDINHKYICPTANNLTFDFQKADFLSLNTFYENVDWRYIFSKCKNINHITYCLYLLPSTVHWF